MPVAELVNRRYAAEQVRGVDAANRRLTVIISTFDLDSYGTRIDQNGWDFTAFRKNPVICWAHDDRGYTGSNGLPVAKGVPESIRTQNQQTFMDLQFPPEGDFPLADTIFKLAAGGYINAVSVGFEPSEWEDVEEDDNGYKRKVRVYKKQKLVELSIVTIPSNSNALIQRAREKNREAEAEQFRAMAADAERIAEGMREKELDLGGIKVRVMACDFDDVKRMSDFIAAAQGVGMDLKESEKAKEEFTKRWAYFEKKQPANKAATGVLKKFFEKAGEKQPDDEEKAWLRMGELIERKEEKQPEPPAPTPEAKTAPPEAPAAARKASVRFTPEDVQALISTVSRAYFESGVKALQRGLPVKSAGKLIDGLSSVPLSITQFTQDGSNT